MMTPRLAVLLMLLTPPGLEAEVPPEAPAGTETGASVVRSADGGVRLFIGGKDVGAGALNVYYLPDEGIGVRGGNEVPRYGSLRWTRNTEKLIDQAAENKAGLVLLNVWWADLDKSSSRPKSIGDALDFKPLDQVFDHALEKGVFIMPVLVFFPFAPEWWLKENAFPPFNKGKTCELCETDSEGNVYNNPSMNCAKVQRDWGLFIKALVGRYRSHPALAGWDFGVGATGEDNYGPNYITLMGFGNASQRIRKAPLMLTDYSPFFAGEFRKWLRRKYSSDEDLRKAWRDRDVALADVEVPAPPAMFQGAGPVRGFPDPTDIFALAHRNGDEDRLSPRGRDFYEFRNLMRRRDREYYSRLLRTSDPAHVVILTAASEDAMADGSLADGYSFSLGWPGSKAAENMFYYHALDISSRAAAHGKLAILSSEHVCDMEARSSTGDCEPPGHLRFMKRLGESIRCAGGIFAYTAAPYDPSSYDNGSWIPPVWFSPEAMKLAGEIGASAARPGCLCPLVEEAYSASGCPSRSRGMNCDLLAKLPVPQCDGLRGKALADGADAAPAPGGRCGDGICDAFEKKVHRCPEDCARRTGRGYP